MAAKVKIFAGYPGNVEKQMNEWLADKKKNIVSMSQSHTYTNLDRHEMLLTVVYIEE